MLPDNTETRLGVAGKSTEAEAELAADVRQDKREVIHSITAILANNEKNFNN